MDDLDDVVRREQLLLDPAVRADPAAVERLLHRDFHEVGVSGREWDRAAIVAALAADPGVTGTASDLVPTRLADDVVLLTYRSGDGARRSSVWVRDPDAGWVLRFHQGTPPPGRDGR